MARNKRPALTSPWKIGFLVSLLLVAMSVGVGYLITRTFNISWSWIQFNGAWNDWTFRRDPFMTEMLPLAVLVPVLCMLSYFLVTSAVRRYRAYLDSGLDYKNLVQSIRAIDDLQDEKSIRGLGNHPELRDFLLNTRAGILEREAAFENREAVLAEKEALAARYDNVTSEAARLIDAVAGGRNGAITGEIEFEIEEFGQVATAIRDNLLGPDNSNADAIEQLGQTADALRERLDEIHDEVAAGQDVARELEEEVTRLRNTSVASEGSAADAPADALLVISRLDSISEVLRGLGEETRSVAVNTALHASAGAGNGANGDGVVALADEVREVAAKFNGIAQQWEEASENARGSMESLAQNSTSAPVSSSVDALATKMGLWAERSVVLTEKIKAFQEHYGDAVGALHAALGGETASEPAPVADNTSFDAVDFETSTDPAPHWGEQSSDDDALELEQQSEAVGFETIDTPQVSDESSDVGLDGFEKQEGIFGDGAGTEAGDSAEDEQLFTDIPQGEEPVTGLDDEPAAAEPPSGFQPIEGLESTSYNAEPAAAPEASAADTAPDQPAADFVHEFEEPGQEAPSEAVPDVAPEPEDKVYDIDPEPYQPDSSDQDDSVLPDLTPPEAAEEVPVAVAAEDDAIDLYALGAVDYEPDNVLHNA